MSALIALIYGTIFIFLFVVLGAVFGFPLILYGLLVCAVVGLIMNPARSKDVEENS